MKKALLLIGLMCLGFYSISQVSFCPPGATWNALFIPNFAGPQGFPGQRGNFTAQYVGDTIIGSDAARILAHDWFFGYCEGSQRRRTYLKQKGDTILFRNWLTKKWEILFNFAAEPGQSWKVDSVGTLSYTVQVKSVDSVEHNSFWLKRLYLTYHAIQSNSWPIPSFQFNAYATERIGGSHHLFNLTDGMGGFCDQEVYLQMLCYEDPAIGLIQFSSLPCEYSNLVGSPERPREEIKISPNPTSGKLTLTVKRDIKKLDLIDITGNVIMTCDTDQPEVIVDLSEQAPGIYFLKITNTDNSTGVYKVIRQ